MYIQTERLTITEFTQAMARSHHLNSLDADNREFLSDEVCETVEAAREKIAWLAGYYENADGPLVYPVLLQDATHIGHVQACPIYEGWEVGFHIAAAHTGRGYATEAVRAFLPVVMQRLGIGRIMGIARADNPASRRVLEKCGFVLESETPGVCRYSYTLEITIREATIDDAPACAEIHCLGWETAYAGFVPAAYLAQRRPNRLEKWQGYLASGLYEYYVPVLDGKAVGFLSLREPEAHENLPDCYYEVGGIYLHPSVYRQGIGRQLMCFAEEKAREKGKTAMMLWVFEDNANSRRFYEACGYRPDGAAEINEYGGKPLRALRYVKEEI